MTAADALHLALSVITLSAAMIIEPRIFNGCVLGITRGRLKVKREPLWKVFAAVANQKPLPILA